MTDLGPTPIIDADSHFTEPPDLWTSRVPEAWRGRVPVQKTVDGKTSWYVDDELWASIGGNTIRTPHQKVLGSHIIQPFDDVDPSAWSVPERLKLMDEMGVLAQIVYPNAIGFASNHIFALEDLEQRKVILQAYNDFHMDIQEASGGRLVPQPVLPVWDMDLTVGEMTRLIERGARGFTLSDKPELIGLPELDQPYFEPMWETFDQTGTVANFHIGSGARREEQEAMRRQEVADRAPGTVTTFWSSFGPQRRLATHATQMYMSNVRIIINFCMSDMFDRFPNLKIVSAESGIGWIPFILEACEYQLDEMVTDVAEVSRQRRRPTDYFRDHFSVMFWFERIAPAKLINDIGVNNVMVETDVPHPTCLFPGAKEHFAKVLADVAPEVRRRVLWENAAELYRIAVPAA